MTYTILPKLIILKHTELPKDQLVLSFKLYITIVVCIPELVLDETRRD